MPMQCFIRVNNVIICQEVAYGRLKTKERFKLLALKVVVVGCERWSLASRKPTEKSDVTKTGNGERGTGNECTAVIRLRIQNGVGNDVYKPRF